MNIADNAHNTSAVALGRSMLCYANGGRVLELQFENCQNISVGTTPLGSGAGGSDIWSRRVEKPREMCRPTR